MVAHMCLLCAIARIEWPATYHLARPAPFLFMYAWHHRVHILVLIFLSFCFFLGHLFRSDLQMHRVPQRWCKHRLFVHYMCALFVSCAMRWASVRGLVSLSFFVRSYARPLARYGVHVLLQFLFRAGHPLACNGTPSTSRTTRSDMLLTYLALILASCRPHV